MQKTFLIIGSILAGLAVGLGALAAHGLKKIADPETLGIYETGVRYQMYHSLALLAVGILVDRISNTSAISWAGYLFIAGIVLFSGSLYLIASLKVMNKITPAAIGILTPLGGVLFILGWIMLLIAVLKK